MFLPINYTKRILVMVPLVSFLAALRILTEAQTCNNGVGRLVYEKITDYKLAGTGGSVAGPTGGTSRDGQSAVGASGGPKTLGGAKELVTRTDVPIRVLEECVRRCQDDRTTLIANCVAFDFAPGKRRSSPFVASQANEIVGGVGSGRTDQSGPSSGFGFGPPGPGGHPMATLTAEYEESKCILYSDRGDPDGGDTLLRQVNSWHFNEICLSSTKVNTDCPNRLYVFDRIPGYRFDSMSGTGSTEKELITANRSECEDKCLNEYSFPCRSVTYDRSTSKCYLSKETRLMNPKGFRSDPNCDYMENMCLPRAQMCQTTAYILETGKELDGTYEREILSARDFTQCSTYCVKSLEERGFLCRSFMYDDGGHTCILYDEDPVSFVDQSAGGYYDSSSTGGSSASSSGQVSRPLKSSPGDLYRVICMNSETDAGGLMNNATLECYRRKRLEGGHQVELQAATFYLCLDECTRRFGHACRAVEYSTRGRSCRFSSYDPIQGATPYHRLVDDVNYDFYKFLWYRQPYPSPYGPLMGPMAPQGHNGYPYMHSGMAPPTSSWGQRMELSNPSYGPRYGPMPYPGPTYGSGVANYPNMATNYAASPSTVNMGFSQDPSRAGWGYNQRGGGGQAGPGGGYSNPATYGRYYGSGNSGSGSGVTYDSRYGIIRPAHPSSSMGGPSSSSSGSSITASSSVISSSAAQGGGGVHYPGPYAGSGQDLSAASGGHMSGHHSVQLTHPGGGPPPHPGNQHLSLPAMHHYYATPPHHPLSNVLPQAYGIPYSQSSSAGYVSGNSLGPGGAAAASNYATQSIPDKCKFGSAASASSAQPMPYSAAVLAPGSFVRVGFGTRLRSHYVFKVIRAPTLADCERACAESTEPTCKSFNYRGFFPAENCELSLYDSKQLKLDNPNYYEHNTQFDFFERDPLQALATVQGGGGGNSIGNAAAAGAGLYPAECMEVSQTCTPDGMEFTLRTPEGFYGRIYTYGFYDSCFYDGNGGTVSVLRISRSNGFPRCGTQAIGEAITNVVVVQFNDFVQTSRDKKYNLTCYFSGPGEAVVTSNYLDTKTDGYDDRRYPTQIEHLPAQNILTSNVVLRVLYRGTPTNTIVVGDLLTFRLEARGAYRYDFFNSDIFATNVIAKDPYTGRQVNLIDSRGCPVDLYVFPELHKTPDGGLEAEFYAFKIPDSNFLVFQATVKTCRGPCEPVICSDRGRGPGSFPSWGRRRRRSVNETADEQIASSSSVVAGSNSSEPEADSLTRAQDDQEEVHELLRVYLSREEIPASQAEQSADSAASLPGLAAALLASASHNPAALQLAIQSGAVNNLLNTPAAVAAALSGGFPPPIQTIQPGSLSSLAHQTSSSAHVVCLQKGNYYALLGLIVALAGILFGVCAVSFFALKKSKFAIKSFVSKLVNSTSGSSENGGGGSFSSGIYSFSWGRARGSAAQSSQSGLSLNPQQKPPNNQPTAPSGHSYQSGLQDPIYSDPSQGTHQQNGGGGGVGAGMPGDRPRSLRSVTTVTPSKIINLLN